MYWNMAENRKKENSAIIYQVHWFKEQNWEQACVTNIITVAIQAVRNQEMEFMLSQNHS